MNNFLAVHSPEDVICRARYGHLPDDFSLTFSEWAFADLGSMRAAYDLQSKLRLFTSVMCEHGFTVTWSEDVRQQVYLCRCYRDRPRAPMDTLDDPDVIDV